MEKKARTKCEIYTRVMWYHRPVSSFNIWKKSEFYSRKYFKENISNKNEFVLLNVFIEKYLVEEC